MSLETDMVKTNMSNLVTKSNVLIEASYKLRSIEQKIILCLASNIQLHDSDFKTYTLPIKEFNQLLGLKGSPKYSELRKITKELMQKIFEIKMENKVVQVAWLSYVAYNKNEGTIDLRFDPFLKPYLLHLKKEFTSYKLENVLKLNSFYAIRIYELLKQYEQMKERTFCLGELRKVLGAEDIYSAYGNFKQRILLAAQKELTKKTDITFEIIEVKNGRRVDKIKFKIISNNKENTEQNKKSPLTNLFFKKAQNLAISMGFNLTEEQYEKWIDFGEERIIKVLNELKDKKHIRDPLAYISHILKQQTINSTQSVLEKENQLEQHILTALVSHFKQTKEPLPDWFIERQAISYITETLYLDPTQANLLLEKIKDTLFNIIRDK